MVKPYLLTVPLVSGSRTRLLCRWNFCDRLKPCPYRRLSHYSLAPSVDEALRSRLMTIDHSIDALGYACMHLKSVRTTGILVLNIKCLNCLRECASLYVTLQY